jgi:hypothetical protein
MPWQDMAGNYIDFCDHVHEIGCVAGRQPKPENHIIQASSSLARHVAPAVSCNEHGGNLRNPNRYRPSRSIRQFAQVENPRCLSSPRKNGAGRAIPDCGDACFASRALYALAPDKNARPASYSACQELRGRPSRELQPRAIPLSAGLVHARYHLAHRAKLQCTHQMRHRTHAALHFCIVQCVGFPNSPAMHDGLKPTAGTRWQVGTS